jgi:hypothetical protein
MTESQPSEDPHLGRILYAFEPPSLWQMVAGLIGTALGLGLFLLWGEFLRKITLTVAGLGAAAFVIGLWRYSEVVEFGTRGIRRRKWGGSTELLYDEIGAVSHVKSESVTVYSSLSIEPREPGKPTIQFYRFDEGPFPEAERLMVAAIVESIQERFKRGEPFEWLPGVRLWREGLELSPPAAPNSRMVPYREVGAWKPSDAGLTLQTKAGDPLLTSTLDGRNFFVCYELLGRLTAESA